MIKWFKICFRNDNILKKYNIQYSTVYVNGLARGLSIGHSLSSFIDKDGYEKNNKISTSNLQVVFKHMHHMSK